MPSLSEFNVSTLGHALETAGANRGHSTRILRAWVESAGQMTSESLNLGKRVDACVRQWTTRISSILTRRQSGDGTVKLLIGMNSGGAVESVLMPAFRPDRAAGCVSSQIGCAMGCDFCASTKNGLERNLTAGEIVEQFLHLKHEGQTLGRRLQTLVFMGMGEPMQNLPEVIEAIRRIADPQISGIGWRHVTVSTVGIVPGIDALADADLGVHLALSLHGADDETRSQIVPVNRRYPIADVLAAMERYRIRSGRIPTIEWCLIDGINDSDDQAGRLARLIQNYRAHVNIIPYNSIGLSLRGIAYRKPPDERMARFISILRDRGVVAHFRHTRGNDVSAACGQLRQQTVDSGKLHI